MQNESHHWKRRHDELVRARLQGLRAMSSHERTELRERFASLFNEAEGALGHDPADTDVQKLAGRYAVLLRTLKPEGDLDLQLQKLVAAYLSDARQTDAPAPPEPPFGGKRVWEYMARALAVQSV